ncbi:MMPL family transporter, partial [bacterium]|nr:MMPL family transporter [bacterium]
LPCFLTSITTFAGFLGLLMANVKMVNQFAMYTALGVMISYINTIVLLPVMLSLKTNYSFYFQELEKYIQKFFLLLFRFLRCYRQPLFYLFIILHVIIISGMFHIKVIGYVFDDLHKSCSISKDIQKASKLHKGLVPINIFFSAKDDGIIFQLEKLKLIEKLEEIVKKEPEITNAISVVTYLKEIAYKLEGVEVLPEEEFRIRNYINAYLCDNSKFALELLSEEFTSGQIKCRIQDMGSEKFEGFLKRLKKNTELDNSQLQINVTGLSTVVQEVYKFLVWGILKSTFATILVITIIFIFVFRKFRDVLMAIIINLLPLLYGAGLMGWIGIRVNISVIVIFSIAFGLVVDDTIHLLYRFTTLRREKNKLQPSTIVLKTLLYSGRGVIYTSIVIIFGFLVMYFSVFSLQYYMGSLLAMIVFVALIFDMIYLPVLLLKNKNLSKI